MNTKNMIQTVAGYMAATAFTESHTREDNIEEREEEGLGIAISQWAEWDGLKILRVFSSALEDSNFDDEAKQVLEMIKAVENE